MPTYSRFQKKPSPNLLPSKMSSSSPSKSPLCTSHETPQALSGLPSQPHEVWGLTSFQPVVSAFLGDLHRAANETGLRHPVKSPRTDWQGIVRRDKRDRKGAKTQEAVYGWGMVRQRPTLLPQNQQQHSADPGGSSVQPVRRTEPAFLDVPEGA